MAFADYTSRGAVAVITFAMIEQGLAVMKRTMEATAAANLR